MTGGTDTTPSTVRAFAPAGVRLLDFPERRGKAAVLNDSVPRTRGEIVMFSDANTRIDPMPPAGSSAGSAEPRMGVVGGRLVLVAPAPATGRNADGLYWKYETYLKRCEESSAPCSGQTGRSTPCGKRATSRYPRERSLTTSSPHFWLGCTAAAGSCTSPTRSPTKRRPRTSALSSSGEPGSGRAGSRVSGSLPHSSTPGKESSRSHSSRTKSSAGSARSS